MLVAHGFGGSKASVDTDARDLAARGFVVLAWSARGFGASGGQIALNAPDYEVADARALVDWLAARPEVVQDGPGDPRVGVTGGSYGGALVAAAGRVRPAGRRAGAGDHLERPGAGPVPQRRGAAPRRRWTPRRAGRSRRTGCSRPAGRGSSSRPGWGPRGPARSRARPASAAPAADRPGRAPGPQRLGRDDRTRRPAPPPPTPAAARHRVGDLRPVRPGGLRRLHRGGHHRPALPGTAELLRRSSPASVTDRITAPTLLVQGEQDTLFGLDQADANARQIAATGAPVKVAWFAGGHDGGRDRVGASATRSATGSPGTSAGTGRYPIAARTRGPDSPTPWRAGSERPAAPRPAAPSSLPPIRACPARPRVDTQPVALSGDPQVVINRPATTRPRSPRCPGSVARWAASAVG